MPEFLHSMLSNIIPFFLFASAGLAGFIDSVAGGGGLITLPALLVAGLPSHLALGTNKFQSMFGTTFAVANFGRKGKIYLKVALLGVPFALVGSILGAKITLFISVVTLARIIVILLPIVTFFVFISRQLMKPKKAQISYKLVPVACFFVGLYDGFLGPGTGTFLILALVLAAKLPLVNATATAKVLNLASNVGAFVTFFISKNIFFEYAIVMAAGNIVGNVLGSHYAIKHGDKFIQKVLIVSLTLLFVYLAGKYF